MTRKAMVVDLNRCVGCLSCMVACKAENDVEISKYWNWVERVGPTGKFPDTEMYFLPMQCQHCETPECVTVCPTGASYKREDGVVLVDKDKCIGCTFCVEACPYNARVMSSNNVVGKCTLCTHLLDKGEQPYCVRNCGGKCRVVGDLDDPKSDASKLLKSAGKANVYQLGNVGNKPVGAYVLRNLKWQEQYDGKVKQ